MSSTIVPNKSKTAVGSDSAGLNTCNDEGTVSGKYTGKTGRITDQNAKYVTQNAVAVKYILVKLGPDMSRPDK